MEENSERNINFYNLNAKDKIDNIEIYEEALRYAINNQYINNIAITGKFGSGKTSIINTYRNKHPEKKFFNISLATFNNKLDDRDSIERSILQQLFYRTSNKNIPYSRFKRISNISKKELIEKILKIVITILLIIGTGYLLINPNFFKADEFSDFLKMVSTNYFSSINRGLASIILTVLFISSIGYTIYKILEYVIAKIKLSPKLNLKRENIELEVKTEGNDINEHTIFNKYLDEIMYFFETTEYDVIVIEDLDRFKGQADVIFIKLREICNMINESEDIKKKIKFIYAIEDDIFKNDERTKFFDFIIPVIPVLDANNAEGIIKDRLEELEIDCDQNFIGNISFFIKDMRTFNNISNEFLIYKDRLNYNRKKVQIKSLEDKKILSMIIYKNLNSQEFSKIQNNEGNLSNIFKNKNLNILKVIQESRAKLKEIEGKIEKSKNEPLKDIEELKNMLILKIIKLTHEGVNQIRINNTYYNKDEILSNDFNIQDLVNATLYSGHNFKEIMSKEELEERLNNVQLKADNNYNLILKKKKELILKIEHIKALNMKQLISEYGISSFFTEEEKKDVLLIMLISNGYIDESYLEYINYFYPGVLTLEDKEFLINIQSYGKPIYDYNIYDPNTVINKIEDDRFYNYSVLNYSLIDNVLCLDIEEKRKRLYSQLKNNSNEVKIFLENYISITKEMEKFITFITSNWIEIWVWIKSNLSNDIQKAYLYNIIKYANIDIIKQININNEFKNSIEKEQDFIEHFNSSQEIEKASKVILELNVKFDKLERKDILLDLGEFILQNNLYKINYNLINSILTEKFKVGIEKCNNMNYTIIMNTKEETFISYISNNIEEYVKNVLLDERINIQDQEEDIIKLLSNSEIGISLRKKIIEKQKTIVTNISKVPKELWKDLLKYSKVKCCWDNIFLYYNEESITESLIKFIKVNQSQINQIQENEIKTNYKCICDLIVESDIEFLDLIPNNSVDAELIDRIEDKDKIKELINKIKISIDNYNKIRENNYDLLSDYICKDIKFFKDNQDSFEYDNIDFYNILSNNKIKNSDKIELIEKMKIDIECENKESAAVYFELLTNTKKLIQVNKNLLISVIENLKDINDKIQILTRYLMSLDEDTISTILEKLEKPYCNIVGNKIPTINKGKTNNKFIEAIKEKNLSWISTIKEDEKCYKIYKKKS